jgi:hypothetical protein
MILTARLTLPHKSLPSAGCLTVVRMFSRFAAYWMTSLNISILLHERFMSATMAFLMTQKLGNHFLKE